MKSTGEDKPMLYRLFYSLNLRIALPLRLQKKFTLLTLFQQLALADKTVLFG